MGVKKVLTIKLEIEVNDKVTRYSRLENTYLKMITSAMEVASAHMPTGSIEQITSHARWDYRHWDPQPLTITYTKGENPMLQVPADEGIEWEDEG